MAETKEREKGSAKAGNFCNDGLGEVLYDPELTPMVSGAARRGSVPQKTAISGVFVLCLFRRNQTQGGLSGARQRQKSFAQWRTVILREGGGSYKGDADKGKRVTF